MAIEINGKVYRNLQEQVEKNKEDIEELQEQEPGVVYTAGDGIDITENVISVDDTVALKTDLSVYATKSELNGYIKDNDTNYASTFRGKGVYVKEEGTYTATSYADGSIGRSIPNQPGYTYTLPSATGTLALTSVIPSLTNYVTLDGNQTITGVKTFGEVHVTDAYGNCDVNSYRISLNTEESDHNREVAIYLGNVDASYIQYRKSVPGPSGTSVNNIYLLPHQDVPGVHDYTLATTADIPTLSGLTMYNYKITLGGLDYNTSTARSAVYIISLPYQWDYSQLTKYDIIRLVPVYSLVADEGNGSSNKGVGVFSWHTGTIATIRWVDGTNTLMDFTGSWDATVEAASPTHW